MSTDRSEHQIALDTALMAGACDACVAELEQLQRDAMPPPYRHCHVEYPAGRRTLTAHYLDMGDDHNFMRRRVQVGDPEMDLMCAAVNALPVLLAELARLRRVETAAQAVNESWRGVDEMPPWLWHALAALSAALRGEEGGAGA